MKNLGLMTEVEMAEVKNFEIYEEVNVDAMAWSWTVAGKIALGVASAFL